MANVGRLNVDLVARTGRFKAGLQKAKGDLRSFDGSVRKGDYVLGNFSTSASSASASVAKLNDKTSMAAKSMKTFFGVLAGVGILRSISTQILNTTNEIDELVAQSTKFGISTDALMALHRAAQMNNVEITKFDMAFQRMGRRIGEAAVGMGEAQGALKELGLDAKELKRIGLAESFYRISDAVAKVRSPMDKMRLVMKLADSEGVDLVKMFAIGTTQLRAYEEGAKRMGLTLSDVQKYQADAATDSFADLKNATFVLWKEIAYATGNLQNFALGLTKIIQKTTRLIDVTRFWIGVKKEAYSPIELTAEAQGELDAMPLEKLGDQLEKTTVKYSALAERIMKTREAIFGLESVQKHIWMEQARAAGPSAEAKMRQQISYWEQYASWQERVLEYWQKMNDAMSGKTAMDNRIAQLTDQIGMLEQSLSNKGQLGQGSASDYAGAQARGRSGTYVNGVRITTQMVDTLKQQLDALRKIASNTENPAPTGALAV